MNTSLPKHNSSLSVAMFDARNGLTSLAEARNADVRAHCITMLQTDAATLSESVWRLHCQLVITDDWLTAHPDAPDYRAREDRWLGAVKRYQAGMDLLTEIIAALEQHQPRTAHEQAAMPIDGMAASSRHQPHWEA